MADEKKPEPMVEIYQGDTLALTEEGKKMSMTPSDLVKIGRPNQFKVLLLCSWDGEPHVVLNPCCHYYKKEDGEERCGGHALKYFEKTTPPDPIEEPEPPSRTTRSRHPDYRNTRAALPFLGEIASVEYDAERKYLKVTLFQGDPFEAEGPIAMWVAGMLAQKGYI